MARMVRMGRMGRMDGEFEQKGTKGREGTPELCRSEGVGDVVVRPSSRRPRCRKDQLIRCLS